MEQHGSHLLLDASRHPLSSRVSWNLRHRCSVTSGSRLIIALSGGADSTTLLSIIAALSTRSGGPTIVGAVHVHHHLRLEADAEMEVARSSALAVGVPFIERHVRVDSGNVLACARTARYEALEDASREFGATDVVTAHHADDQLESLLMQMCRGDLAESPGTAWRCAVSGHRPIIRPLLDIARADVRSAAFALGLNWVEDPSNRSVHRTRGRMRAELEPSIHALWPHAGSHAARFTHLAQSWSQLAGESLRRAIGVGPQWNRAAIASVHPDLLVWWLSQCAAPPCSSELLTSIVHAIRDDSTEPREWGGGTTSLWTLDARTLSYRIIPGS
ncbi:MAG: tRNA lysidine(34) synthetase TilS [Planctomycetota bacterium]|nr:tRNA lysidine(34) synthetase TilS [Planctomycetota bacterium]